MLAMYWFRRSVAASPACPKPSTESGGRRMAVQEVLKALGSWEIKLQGGVPRDVLDSLDYFGHVAIIPGRLDPLQYGDNLLTTARYVGVVRTKTIGDDG